MIVTVNEFYIYKAFKLSYMPEIMTTTQNQPIGVFWF